MFLRFALSSFLLVILFTKSVFAITCSNAQVTVDPRSLAASTSTNTLGVGLATFTIPVGITYYVVGTRAKASKSSDPTIYEEGLITAYSGSSLTINVDTVVGSGTLSSWTIGEENVTHSSVQFSWKCDADAAYARAKWGINNTYGCTTVAGVNAGPCIQGLAGAINIPAGWYFIRDLVGLPANAKIYFAGSSSTDNVTFSADTTQLSTFTLPLPAGGHPIYPAPPASFVTCADPGVNCTHHGHAWVIQPNTCAGLSFTGGTSPNYTQLQTSDCRDSTNGYATQTVDLQAAINGGVTGSTWGHTAVAKAGDVILLPVGSSNAQLYNYNTYVNALGLADAPDAANSGGTPIQITGWDGSGVFTTTIPHGLSDGNQIMMGMLGATQLSSDRLPLPLDAGYPYYVINPTSMTFQLSETLGGAAITPDPRDPTFINNACYIVGNSIPTWPAEEEILVRTAAPDSQLPPQGVRLDSSYAGSLAYIRNNTVYPNLAFGPAFTFSSGCLAHGYRFLGTRWDWAPMCSGNVTDCHSFFYPELSTARSTSHITWDRSYVAGANDGNGNPYPNRTAKWAYLDGQYMAFVNGMIDNIGIWTPSNLYAYGSSTDGTPVTANNSSTQTFTGAFYPGSPNGAGCTSSPTLTVGSGTFSFLWEISQDCNTYYVTVNAGSSVTCSISGGATCSVSSASLSNPCPFTPAYATSGGLFTRFPTACIDVLSGAIHSISWAPSSVSTDGATVFSLSSGIAIAAVYGPGPYKIDNNYLHNLFGIAVYLSTGDGDSVLQQIPTGPRNCSTLDSNIGCLQHRLFGDLTYSRNMDVIDHVFLPNPWTNNSWNHMLFSMRQPIETKDSQRVKYVGNYTGGVYCSDSNISGPIIEVGSLNSTSGAFVTQQQTADVEYAYNTGAGSCDERQLIGKYEGGPIDQSQPTQRYWDHDNISFNVSRTFNTSWTSQNINNSGHGTPVTIGGGPSDVTYEHNAWDVPTGPAPNFLISGDGSIEGGTVRNSFLSYSNDAAQGGIWSNNVGYYIPNYPDNYGIFGNGVLNNWYPYLSWVNNWMVSGYQVSYPFNTTLLDMTSTQVSAVAADSSWAALGGTGFVNPTCSSPNPCVAVRKAAVGWINPVPVNTTPAYSSWSPNQYRLNKDSVYASSGANRGSDGKDIGPDIEKMIIAQGVVQNAHALNFVSGGATVVWIAPNSTFGCPLDWTDGDATFAPANIHRIAGVAGSRVQSLDITGATSGHTVNWRADCEVQQPTGSFVTR